MKAPSFHTLALVLSLAFGSGWAQAQGTASSSASPAQGTATSAQQPSNTAAEATKLSHGDRKFIEDAAKGGLFEVKSGQLAQSNASDPAVKEFANKLVQDHTKANDELTKIAQAKNLQMPGSPSWGERHELNKLGKLNGAAFDREFARDETKDHQKDIKKFEKATAKLKDTDLKSWAEKTLPVLREHLAMAQKLSETGASNAAATNRQSSHS